MADKNYSVQTGSRVDVRFSLNTDSDTASIYDSGFSTVSELAKFPELQVKNSTTKLENYDKDHTNVLVGNQEISPTTLVVNEIPGDETQVALKKAADDKKLVRFQNLYIIDTGENHSNQTVSYIIYDAYVKGYKVTAANSVSQITYSLEPTGRVLAEGMSEAGVVLRQGDYGVGAGMSEFPGPKDTSSFIGNSWRTFDGSNGDNPIHQDTTLIHSQPNETRAWQITAPVEGTPDLYVRNIQKSGSDTIKSEWAKVYTDQSRPTPDDINAVNKTGDTMTGDLKISQGSLYVGSARLRANAAPDNQFILSSNQSNVYIRPNGDNAPSNQYIFSPNGNFTVPTVVAQAVKIATQGTASNDALRYDTWQRNSFTKNNDQISNQDWNSLTNYGTYKIQNNVGSNGPDLYKYGILNVFLTDASEGRIVQVYYPHRSGADSTNAFAYRMRNANVWTAWNIIRNEAYNDAKYVKSSGDTMTGELVMAPAKWIKGGNSSKTLDLIQTDGTISKVYVGSRSSGGTVFRVPDSKKLTIESNGGTGVIYSTLNKPTADDVGALTKDQFVSESNKRFAIFPNTLPTDKPWLKVGTFTLGQNGQIVSLSIKGGAGYNGQTGQIGFAELAIKTGNNSQAVNSVGRASLVVSTYGQNNVINDAYIIEATEHNYELWVNTGVYSIGMLVEVHNDEYYVQNKVQWDLKTRADGIPSNAKLDKTVQRLADKSYVDNIWTGGTFTGSVNLKSGLEINDTARGSKNYIRPGNGDGASYNSCNMDIASCNGIGFYNLTTQGIQERVGFINARSGTLRMAGNLIADGNISVGTSQKSDNIQQAITFDRNRGTLSFGNNNTGFDIHAAHENSIMYFGPNGKSGRIINTLNAQEQLNSVFVSKQNVSQQDIKSPLNIITSGSQSSWYYMDGTPLVCARNSNVYVGSDSGFIELRASTGVDFKLRTKDSTGTIYSTLNKPTAYEVGAYSKAESDSRFVSRTGDTVNGDLTVNGITTSRVGKFLGSNNFDPANQGSWISWNRLSGSGRFELMNHRGSGKGGFNFWNGVTGNWTLLTEITPEGNIVLNNETQLLGRNTNGESVNLIRIRSNDIVYTGSEKCFFQVVSKGNPYVQLNGNTYKFYHEGNKPTAADVGAVALDSVIDEGTF